MGRGGGGGAMRVAPFAFRAGLSVLSSFVALYLLMQELDSAKSPLCSADKPESAPCPTSVLGEPCSGRGTCSGGLCSCSEEWMGEDCSQAECPNACSGHGECLSGYCVCSDGWAGPNCAIDRLNIFGNVMISSVNLRSLRRTRECLFLTRRMFERDGTVEFLSLAANRNETFDFPQEHLDALPEECPAYDFASCAFVGNSGAMRFSEFGTEIDRHDMVYRFNQAPTHRFEKQVGSRTTFESLNAKHAHNLAREETKWLWRDPIPTYILFEPLKLKETVIQLNKKFPEAQVLIVSPSFFSLVHETYDKLQAQLERHEFGCFSGEKPMSGFYSMLLGSAMCRSIDMYGFDPWEDSMSAGGSSQMRYHYFDVEEPRSGAHSFDATYFMYKLVERSTRVGLRMKTVDVPQDFDWSVEGDEGEGVTGAPASDAGEREEPQVLEDVLVVEQ